MPEQDWQLAQEAIAALNHAEGSSTRTHIQKLLYFAHSWEIASDPRYDFVLHLHGPYSFELDRDLLRMEAFDALSRTRDTAGYGSRYEVPPVAVRTPVQQLADWLGPLPTRTLEALATCEWVERRGGAADLVLRVQEIKPHLSSAEIEAAAEVLHRERARFRDPE